MLNGYSSSANPNPSLAPEIPPQKVLVSTAHTAKTKRSRKALKQVKPHPSQNSKTDEAKSTPNADAAVVENEKTEIEIDINEPEPPSRDDEISDDPISLYLEEISRISLLSRSKEVYLAKQIEKGNFATEALESEMDLTSAEKSRLQRTVKQGNRARDQLIEANYRLVISITKKYASRGVAFMDLIQEGNIGLIKAVDKFDYTRGYKFSTYATWWIRQAVTRAIADQGRTIRVPVHMCERINKLARTTRELAQNLGREPKLEELAEMMETTVEGIQAIQRIAQHPLSLEMPLGEEQESNLGDFLEDLSSPTLVETAANEVLRELIDDALNSLSAREGRVLQLRCGLVDGKPHTLEEVGQKFGVTRERVRQIEAAALRKLRHPSRSRKLKDFLD